MPQILKPSNHYCGYCLPADQLNRSSAALQLLAIGSHNGKKMIELLSSTSNEEMYRKVSVCNKIKIDLYFCISEMIIIWTKNLKSFSTVFIIVLRCHLV